VEIAEPFLYAMHRNHGCLINHADQPSPKVLVRLN
jgi:hypothetical protein